MTNPFQTVCSNAGDGARFTCPGCYEDLDHEAWNGKSGACPSCGREIECTVEYEPVSIYRLVEEDADV